VGTTLNDLTLIKDIDDISLLDRAETVSHSDCSTTTSSSIQSSLDDLLGLRVQSGSGFVEEEDLGVPEEGAGDGYTLLLAAR
jgi:hypothetical protein